MSGRDAAISRLQHDVAIPSQTRTDPAQELQLVNIDTQRSVVKIARLHQATAPNHPCARYRFLGIGVPRGAAGAGTPIEVPWASSGGTNSINDDPSDVG